MENKILSTYNYQILPDSKNCNFLRVNIVVEAISNIIEHDYMTLFRKITDDIALIILNDPPVNTLNINKNPNILCGGIVLASFILITKVSGKNYFSIRLSTILDIAFDELNEITLLILESILGSSIFRNYDF